MRCDVATGLLRVLEGRCDEIGEPPPRLSKDALESLATRALSLVGAGNHVHGRLIVVGLGLELLPRRPPRMAREAVSRGVVAYDATLPSEEQSVLCAHGAGHHVLDRNGDRYEHADAWILTGLLLVPRAAAQTMGAAELVARAFAPEWLTLAMRDFLLDRREFVA